MVAPLPPDRLARRTDPAAFAFATTADLMGPEGIGKYILVRQVLLARAAGTGSADSVNGRVEAGLDALVERVMSYAVRTEAAKVAASVGPGRGARDTKL
jgi:hypothetical protein